MSDEYNLYCAFDIEKHKQTYIDYLEVVIDEDGTVMYAVPSHREKLIAMACAKTGMNREQLNAICPPEYYADFATWLCMVSGAVAVWNSCIVAADLTVKQIGALRRLKMAGLYHGAVPKVGDNHYG